MVKFAKEDAVYKQDRRAFADKYGKRDLWLTIDHWPLYVGQRNLARYMAIADLLRSTLDVPGHVAEFGSWRGANLVFMAKLLKIYAPLCGKLVHCFESFEGLTTFTDSDGAAAGSEGAYRGSYEELCDVLELYRLQDDVVIHKGLIQDTLPAAFPKDDPSVLSFVYCDTDLYEPTKLILESLHPRLAPGGMFVFDEWNYMQWPGETHAANKFVAEHGDKYEMLPVRNAAQPSLVLRRKAN